MKFNVRWWVIPAVLIGVPVGAVLFVFFFAVVCLFLAIEGTVRFLIYWTFFHKTWRQKWKEYQHDLKTTG